jgi:glycosyltransferase involved in cell wall biosynthesis
MGVYPAMRSILHRKQIWFRFIKWSYASPYELVICTQDGSGVEGWLEKAINKDVPKYTLINGVTPSKIAYKTITPFQKIPDNKTVILFLGKLEKYKGCNDFVSAVIKLVHRGYSNIHGVVIGTGSQEELIKKEVKEKNTNNNFTFISRLPHNQVVAAHLRSDIYVSLNRYGGLSNSNLESMRLGSCIVLFEPDHIVGVDVVTSELLGADSVVYVSRDITVEGLADILEDLYLFPKKRNNLGANILKESSKFIPTWEKRVSKEMEILVDIADKSRRL